MPFNPVRLGAHQATTSTVSDPVTIGGMEVPAGGCVLSAIPNEMTWTFLLSTRPTQWGTVANQPVGDMSWFQVVPGEAELREWMRFSSDRKEQAVDVAFRWEKLTGACPIQAHVPGSVVKDLLDTVTEEDVDGGDYLVAVSYSLQEGSHREHALVWADRTVRSSQALSF